MAVVSRAYNRFELDASRGVIKKISDTDRLRGEIGYLTNIPYRFQQYFPRIFDYSTANTDTFVVMEYYDYPTLASYLLERHDLGALDGIMPRLLDTVQFFSEKTHPGNTSFTRAMYIDKTWQEFVAFTDAYALDDSVFTSKHLTINGVDYDNFAYIWSDIRPYLESILPYNASFIHGDFCASNILYSPNGVIKCIDPRGEFGERGCYGDIRYDVAKLMHSFDGGYDFIINDHFTLHEVTPTELEVSVGNYMLSAANDRFQTTFFPTFNQKEITMIQGCIYIGMAARHYDSIDRQRVMYLTGVQLLNEGTAL
jgi:Phosphotransferase enzyme family